MRALVCLLVVLFLDTASSAVAQKKHLIEPPRSIGGDFDRCLAGAVSLPITGLTWQVMRPSRNRYWGQPFDD